MYIESKGQVFSPSGNVTRILVGGDMNFAHEYRYPPHIKLHDNLIKEEYNLSRRIRRKFRKIMCRLFFSPKFYSARIDVPFQEFRLKNPETEKLKSTWLFSYFQTCTRFNIDYSAVTSKFVYPFEKITSFMKEKDLVLANLETPLTESLRNYGFFISDPRYAQAMKDAGVSIVSLANNHMFDAGEIGFLQTMEYLADAGISYTGAGRNLEDARLGKLIELHGMKFIFLSYTQFCNVSFVSVADEYPGILPLDRQLMIDDIKVAKKRADFVFVSLHWGEENQPNVHHKQAEIAHILIDNGADGIIGHHPHVPHGIEIYKKRPILYSLGNFIFGHHNKQWSDNFLAEIVIDKKCIQGIIIHPISGQQAPELIQPELLGGARSDSLLHELQIKSAGFNTGIAIQNHAGYIKIE